MDAIVAKISAMSGVVYVAYPAATIERLHSSLRKILVVMGVFGGALLVISLILLYNTIRLAIYSRRHLINTFKLVGATKWYIIRPFIRTATKQGLYAGVIACLLFLGSLFGLKGTLPEIVSMASLTKYGVVMVSMLVSGLLLSILFTAFSVNKFVNMQSNKIHLY
jgi:cell division transport system permease protein